MPFFLVTLRSLVEADNDQEAATKALGDIEKGGKIRFEVKLDEANVTHVVLGERCADTLPAARTAQPISPGSQARTETLSQEDVDLCVETSSGAVSPKRPDTTTVIAVVVFLGALVVMPLVFGAL